MDKAIKARWVAALRSGKYPQTEHSLHRVVPMPNALYSENSDDPVGFCCLGVLCDLYVQDGKLASLIIDSDGIERYGPVDDNRFSSSRSSSLPTLVVLSAGLSGESKKGSDDLPMVNLPVLVMNQLIARYTKIRQRFPNGVMAPILPIGLATLNDSGVPFNVIADIIEEYL